MSFRFLSYRKHLRLQLVSRVVQEERRERERIFWGTDRLVRKGELQLTFITAMANEFTK